MRQPPKYQAFISSVREELQSAREKVTKALLKGGYIAVGMEAFPATDDRGWAIIHQAIDASDYYILIIGSHYGSIDEGTGLSYTEMEYDYARKHGVPVLAFIRDPNAPVPPKFVDRGTERGDLLERFKAKAHDHHRELWANEDELAGAVVNALHSHVRRDETTGIPRPGYVRGTEVASSVVTEELARLSAENARLVKENARLEEALRQATVDHQPRLQLQWVDLPDGTIGPERLHTRKAHRFSPKAAARIASPHSLMMQADDVLEFVERESRTAWLGFLITNHGDRAAEDVVIDFEVAENLEVEVRRMTVKSQMGSLPIKHLVPRPDVEPIHQAGRPDRHRHRFKSIAPGTSDNLWQMGIVAEQPGEFTFTLNYQIATKAGRAERGSVKVTSVVESVLIYDREGEVEAEVSVEDAAAMPAMGPLPGGLMFPTQDLLDSLMGNDADVAGLRRVLLREQGVADNEEAAGEKEE